MSFVEKVTLMPLTYEQGRDMLLFYKQLSKEQELPAIKQRAEKMQVIINNRLKTVPTMKTGQIPNSKPNIGEPGSSLKSSAEVIDLDEDDAPALKREIPTVWARGKPSGYK
jgi:hypothetical protein